MSDLKIGYDPDDPADLWENITPLSPERFMQAFAMTYECDCCGRKIVPEKLKGIGYVCDDCLESWCWTGYEKGPAPESHFPVCPLAETKP